VTTERPETTTVRILRSTQELLELRDTWDALCWGHPDARLDVFLSVVETLEGVVRPHVLVHLRDGRPDALLVARLEERVLPARFGYATLYRPRVRSVTVVAGGAAGDAAAQARLVGELYAGLHRREADVVLFHHLEVGSTLHAAATRLAPGWRLQQLVEPTPHRVMDLPDGAAALLPSLGKRLRDNFKRSRRMVHKQFGERATIRRFDAPAEAEEVIAALEAVAARTYQRGLGAGFDAERDRPLVTLGLRHGWFRAWVLSIDGEPRAFELGSVHDDRFIVGAKGYDPELARAEIGTALQLHVLEELAGDPAIAAVDFGFGDADYKRRLATRSWDEVDVIVYGRSRRGATAMAGRTVVLAGDRCARRAVGPERIATVKRRWRALRTPRARA
jgi:CelD/BcsL family acetyltransferase involved in cellulose biosynthesis